MIVIYDIYVYIHNIFIMHGVMVWLHTTESYIIPTLRNLSRVQCFVFAWSVVRYGHHWQSNLIQMISFQFRFLRRVLKKLCESWGGCLCPIELYHNKRSRKSLASVAFAANLFASHLDPVTPSLECEKRIVAQKGIESHSVRYFQDMENRQMSSRSRKRVAGNKSACFLNMCIANLNFTSPPLE